MDNEQQPTAPNPGARCVLVVDDEYGVRRFAVKTFRRAGWTALEAESGEEALRVAREHPGSLDLLLTDIFMRHMQGRELAAQLRAERPETKVLFTSGYVAGAILRPDLLSPEEGYLHKPFGPDELLYAALQLFHSREGARQGAVDREAGP